MEIYIHYGIYKTASSFLQTQCARNRDFLKRQGIWFPVSEKDMEMKSGKITPGNGSQITYLLKSLDKKSVNKLVLSWIDEARSNDCERILISDEALIHAFSIEECLKNLEESFIANGISAVKCMAFFRDPVDHCISTYKHRAKKGKIFDFKLWVEQDYETVDVLSRFLQTFHKVNFEWIFRKYNKDGIQMADFFFNNWLNISGIESFYLTQINPSLSFSELSVIQSLGKWDKSLVNFVYNGFLELKKNEKANDIEVENFFRNVAYDILISKKSVFDELNKLLPHDQQLGFKNISQVSSLHCPNFQFSGQQVEALVKSIRKGRAVKNQVKYAGRLILNKIKNK